MKNIQAHTLKRSLCLFLSVLLVLLLIPVTAFAESTGIQPRVTSPMTGYSTASQTVYCGPSTTIYASTGSIGNGEKVYVLGTERGYYHILYSVSGGQKMGYVPQSMIRNVTGGTPEEDDFNGGYAMMEGNYTVWSCNDPSTAVSIGSVNTFEGATILADFVRNGTRITFIEYSSPSGTKRGFLFNAQFSMPLPTCVARVVSSSTLYYGCRPGKTYAVSGSVSTGEYVCVLSINSSGWAYVEYNSTAGRKRGYMSSSSLSYYHKPSNINTSYGRDYSLEVGQGVTQTVYSAPSPDAAPIGTVYSGDMIFYYGPGLESNGFNYIEYYISGTSTLKSGYTLIND